MKFLRNARIRCPDTDTYPLNFAANKRNEAVNIRIRVYGVAKKRGAYIKVIPKFTVSFYVFISFGGVVFS